MRSDLAAETALVKTERLFATAVEGEVNCEIHFVASNASSTLPGMPLWREYPELT